MAGEQESEKQQQHADTDENQTDQAEQSKASSSASLADNISKALAKAGLSTSAAAGPPGSHEERTVVEEITKAASDGITVRELSDEIGIPVNKLNKILLHLERSHRVRSFKGRENRTVKRYILYGLEPSADVTGGTWYENGEVDREMFSMAAKLLIARLGDVAAEAVRQYGTHPASYSAYFEASSLTLAEMAGHLNDTHAFRKSIKPNDVETLMRVYQLDGLYVERQGRFALSMPREQTRSYFGQAREASVLFSQLPCNACPVERSCAPNGSADISPEKCPLLNTYMKNLSW